MKKFRFSLQALLAVRQRAEQKALEEYAQSLVELREAKERLHCLQVEQETWRQQWNAQVVAGVNAGTLMQWQTCGRHLTNRLHRTLAAIREAEEVSRQRLQQMLTARRDREAVENHLQRQRELFRYAVARAEQQTLDEMAQHRKATVSCGGAATTGL